MEIKESPIPPKSKSLNLYLFLIPIFLIFFISLIFTITATEPITSPQKSSLVAEGMFHYSTTGYFEGRKTPAHQGIMEDVSFGHNLIFNDGLDMWAEDMIDDTTNFNLTHIALCNATGSATCGEPLAAQSEPFLEFNNCGLVAANASTGSLGIGNRSIFHTFTSTCNNLEVNVTRLRDEATQRNFSGNSFTLVTLQIDDQLTINITLFATNG